MAFDNNTRNKLQQFVTKARKLLVDEFTGQFQTFFGIQPNGSITEINKLTHLDEDNLDVARRLRERIDHIVNGFDSEKNPYQSAVERVLREQAFTILNRFAAMRMMEERGLIQESIVNGINSKGFQLYSQISGSMLGSTFNRYVCFIHCLWDEIALDLGILFDRNSPYGLLFPRENSLNELLALIDEKDISPLWKEDETIGWIYQYYNSKDERESMRRNSDIPRNNRELAVRNQFFTPRYIVQFLTDNTLGRIWYEMTQGKTKIKESCEYLVIRPNEIFLKKNEEPPDIKINDSNKTNEEILTDKYYVEYRELKDPREITMLDPACGSMHFGLYAFDLYEKIYEEAWDNYPNLFSDLRGNIKDKIDFLKLIPEFIIRYNIHGVDIDPRATQIANLSLWLRAQKSWKEQGIEPQNRPDIKISNIVCAEPMPGEKHLLDEFVKTLNPPILGSLVRDVWDKMLLAGEAGSLLKIENDIQDSIAKAYDDWKALKDTAIQMTFFDNDTSFHQEIFEFELGKVHMEFWEQAEKNVINALKYFLSRGIDTNNYRSTMFLNDSENGFEFIDLCKKKYDIILMNPPFGEATLKTNDLFKVIYPYTYKNIACVFIERAISLLKEKGILGNIVDIATSIRSNYEDFRKYVLFNNNYLSAYNSLGWGVLDNANVETCCYTIVKGGLYNNTSVCSDLDNAPSKEIVLKNIISDLSQKKGSKNLYLFDQKSFLLFPNAAISFSLPGVLRNTFIKNKNIEPYYALVKKGIASGDNNRFYKLFYEVPTTTRRWKYLSNGGDFSPYYRISQMMLDWENNGYKIKNLRLNNGKLKSRPQNLNYFDKFGYTYSKRGEFLNVQIHPKDFGFTDEGQGIFNIKEEYIYSLLAILNSKIIRVLINEYCGQHKSNGYVKLLPIAKLNQEDHSLINNRVLMIIEKLRYVYSLFPDHPEYYGICVFQKDNNPICSIKRLIDDILNDILTIKDEINNAEIYLNELLISKYNLDSQSLEYLDNQCKDMPKIGSVFDSINEEYICDNILEQIVGAALGRWSIKAFKKKEILSSDPFESLPKVSYAFLNRSAKFNEDNFKIDTKGIYDVASLTKNIRIILSCLWDNNASEIEEEINAILGIKLLEQYFTANSEYFSKHLKIYSRGTRVAPIYWPLSTPSNSYTLWIYYHELNDQTLYKCINEFVDPKVKTLNQELKIKQMRLQEWSSDIIYKEIEDLSHFIKELEYFREELLRVAKLPYKPDLNDGVLINAAPLCNLFNHNKWHQITEECWNYLVNGEYDWSHMAYNIWPDRVRKKCEYDSSIAMAHNLEKLFLESTKKKQTKR